MNRKGFTLIELLAAITIMGVLMMVAIPAVSGTIENSRRDTFALIAKDYITTVRDAVIGDSLTCGGVTVSLASQKNMYYYEINTKASGGSNDLMESKGKSPFGNSHVKGYVAWRRSASNNKKMEFSMVLCDESGHGIKTYIGEDDIDRDAISMKDCNINKSPKSVVPPTKPAGLQGTVVPCINKTTLF